MRSLGAPEVHQVSCGEEAPKHTKHMVQKWGFLTFLFCFCAIFLVLSRAFDSFATQGMLDRTVSEAGPLSADHGIVVRAACEILDAANKRAGGAGGEISVAMQYIQVDIV